jgi:cytidylate kinase
MTGVVVVTIDGPAGTGKSSAAAALARRIGFDMLDTGAMYRAVALMAIEAGIDAGDEASLAQLMDSATIRVEFAQRMPIVRINDRDVSGAIRGAEVTAIVSRIASHHEVRARLVAAQREVLAAHPRLVTEGRDQGTVVFPDAAVHVWLDARPEVRARRRTDELRARGVPASEAEVLREILERDASDRGRAEGPLAMPLRAVAIDTSDLTFEAVVDTLERVVREHTGAHATACARGGAM